MMTLSFKKIYSMALIVALTGCNSIEEKPTKAANIFDELELKVAAAQLAKKNSSSWLKSEQSKLTLVGPIYQTGLEKKSAASKALSKVLHYIENNTEKLNQVAQRALSEQFTHIKVSDFILGENQYSYVPAIFNVGYGDEAALNAVFNVALEDKDSAEIGFYIDSQAWQKGVVSLQGYKTVKSKGKERNSTWYHYTLDLSDQENKAKVDALLRMSLYAIGSDIREFASIDRDAVMKFNDKDYVVERGNGDTLAFVYQDRIKLIDNEIKSKIDNLDKERVLNNTVNTRSVYIDESETYATVNTLADYVSRVSLLSLKNANQSTILWESKQWDEYAKKAYFIPRLDTSVILSDRFLTVKKAEKVILKLDAEYINSFNLAAAKDKAFYINKGKAYVLDLVSLAVTPLSISDNLSRLAVSRDAKTLYGLSADNTLSYFDAKNQRISVIKKGIKLSNMQVCGNTHNLLYWHEKQAFLYDRMTKIHNKINLIEPMEGKLTSADCADSENKLLLMTDNGSIRQFDTNSLQQIAQIEGDYDAYDKLNSGHVVNYLSGNEFVYGGKKNLRIRPTTTEIEIRNDYEKRLGRINSARSWLDKSSIKQLVFAEQIASTDLTLYQTLFKQGLTSLVQKNAYLSFLNEERADPLLVANKPSLFNALSGGISVIEDGGIMLVKQDEVESSSLYTTSIPNWDNLGFQVDTLYLGGEGFEPKIYRQLDNAQLTADIVNMALSGNDWLVTTLTNGDVSVESLSKGYEFNETFNAHNAAVTAAALTPDRKLLATSGRDGLIKIWKLTIPQNEDENWVSLDKELKGYAGNVLDLEFINDELLISTGSDQTIKLWDLGRGGVIKSEMLGHTDSIRFALYDESLNQIISASADKSIRVWDIDKAEQIKSFKGLMASYDVQSNMLAYNHNQMVIIKNIVSGDIQGKVSFDREPIALALGFKGTICYLLYPDYISVYKVASGEHINDIPLTNVKDIKQIFSGSNSQDLYIMTDQDAFIINMGRYALYGIENVN